jgi:hypothetical protein
MLLTGSRQVRGLLDGDVNGPFEVRDTFASLAAENAFGTAVTRTYTLRAEAVPGENQFAASPLDKLICRTSVISSLSRIGKLFQVCASG